MDACSKAGLTDKVKELLERMRAKGIKPDMITFNVAIDACAKVRALNVRDYVLRSSELL